MSDRKHGKICNIVEDRGFGFINKVPGEESPDVEFFFHFSGVDGDSNELFLGDTVSFVAAMTSKGRRALKVRREK